MTRKEVTDTKPAVAFTSTCYRAAVVSRTCSAAEWLVFGVLMRVLLPFVHLLLELLCFLFVHKGQSCHTLLDLEAVEKGSILVVCKSIVDFLVP